MRLSFRYLTCHCSDRRLLGFVEAFLGPTQLLRMQPLYVNRRSGSAVWSSANQFGKAGERVAQMLRRNRGNPMCSRMGFGMADQS